MKVNIINLDFDFLFDKIEAYQSNTGRKPKYLIMSPDTLSMIDMKNPIERGHLHGCESSWDYYVLGVIVATRSSMELGEVELV